MFGGPIIDDSGTLLSDWKWITDNGTLTGGAGSATNGSTTIYTVPAGKACYITSAVCAIKTMGTGTATTGMFQVNSKTIMFSDQDLEAVGKIFTMTQSFAIPLKITAGQTVAVGTGASTDTKIFGAFSGYEVDV